MLVQDLRLDGEGRVAITDSRVLARLAATWGATARTRARLNTNCGYCNTADGCSPINKRCNPNTVPNCGCRKAP